MAGCRARALGRALTSRLAALRAASVDRPLMRAIIQLRRDALNILHKLHILDGVDMLNNARASGHESDVT